jgi:hypothetical protein
MGEHPLSGPFWRNVEVEFMRAMPLVAEQRESELAVRRGTCFAGG